MSAWLDFGALKRAVRLEWVLARYRATDLRRSGRAQYRGRCPIHGGKGRDCFQVNLAKQVFHCFSCEVGGSVLDFVAAIEHCGLREAALKVQAWFGGSHLPARAFQETRKELVTKKGVLPLLGFVLRGLDRSHPYLRARGVEPETAALFGVGFYRSAGLLTGRLVIPIENERGELVGYCGRAVDGREPRYKFPAGFAKSRAVFNLSRAAATGEPWVVVVEGFFDCLKVHQAGIRSVVALMGAALHERQEELLRQRFSEVILMLDGDLAGRRASSAIAARLAGRIPLRVIRLAPGSQPDQLSANCLRELVEAARAN